MNYKTRIIFRISLFIQITIFITGISSSQKIFAQEKINVQKISITQAVETALANNPDLQNAQLSIKESKLAKKGVLNFEPTQFNYHHGQINSMLIDQSFEIDQNFGSILTHFKNGKYLNEKIALSETEYTIAEKQVTVLVKKAYLKWVFIINQYKIKQQKADLLKEFVRITQLKYNLGESNVLEQIIAETEYASVNNEIQKIKEELMIAENNLKQIMNKEGDYIPESDSLEIISLNPSTDTDERFSSAILLNYYNNLYLIEQAKLNIERSKFFPEISAGYFNQEINNTPGFNGWSIGVSFPVWFIPQNVSVQQAKIESEKALNTLEYQKFNIEKEIENLVIKLDQLQNNLIYYHENALIKADALITMATLQFEKEDIEYFEFLESIKTALDIKLNYLNTLFEYNITAVDLEFYIK